MSVMVFQKQNFGWVGGVCSIHFFGDFFNFAKPLSLRIRKKRVANVEVDGGPASTTFHKDKSTR